MNASTASSGTYPFLSDREIRELRTVLYPVTGIPEHVSIINHEPLPAFHHERHPVRFFLLSCAGVVIDVNINERHLISSNRARLNADMRIRRIDRDGTAMERHLNL